MVTVVRRMAVETHRESNFFERDVLPSNASSIQSEQSRMRSEIRRTSWPYQYLWTQS